MGGGAWGGLGGRGNEIARRGDPLRVLASPQAETYLGRDACPETALELSRNR